MAGEDLVVTSGLDLAGLQRDFRRGIGLADQFVSDLQRALSSRDLIGDLTPAGRRAGASLARGLSGSLVGIGTDLARSLDLSSAIATQGAVAGREFTNALGVAIGGADDTLNRIAASVDLSSGGERAGLQFTTGIARVISAEAPALRSAMSQAIVPATVATDIGRLQTVVTAALAQLPASFAASGAASGAALITGIAGELAGARQVIGSFSQETSRAITAALTIGDVSAVGDRAGRLLAVSVASGITAEAPRVRGALATALVPSTLAPEVGRITGVFTTAGQEIVGLLGAAGTTGGQALVRNLSAEVGRGASVLRQLTQGAQIGVVVDAGPVRQLVSEQQKLLTATTQTTAAMRDLDAGVDAIDAQGITRATAATRTLADAQREWLREASAGSVAAQSLWQRQRDAAFQAGQQAKRNADEAGRAAQQEVAARAQVRAELQHDITALGQYGGQVDATSRRARQAWLAEAAAIKQQARDVGVSAAEMKRLDGIVDQVTQSFREQDAAVRSAAASIRNAGQAGSRFGAGVVDLGGFRRQAETAKGAISQVTVAGRSLTQITNRLGPSLVGVGFGLEALARGGASADSGLRTALRAVASFAAFFGPKGFIVAGAAAATAAIIDMFSKSRDEMKSTTEQFKKSIDDMVKNVDTIGLQKELRDLDLGVPTRAADGTVKLTGGLRVLRAELEAAKEAQRAAFAGQGGSIFKTSQEVTRLTAEVAKQDAVYKSLVTTILTLQSAGNDPALRKPFTITASTTGAKEAGDALKALRDEVAVLTTAYEQLAGQSDLQTPIAERLTDIHERIARVLGTQKGVASEIVNEYRAMLGELQQIDAVLIETTRRSLPGGVAPTIDAPKITAIIDKVEVPRSTRITLPAEFDARSLNDSLRGAISSLSTAQTQETFAKIFGSRQQVAQATKTVNTETANLTRTFKAALDAELALAASGKLNVTRINEIIAAARALGIDLEKVSRFAGFADMTNGVLDLGAALRDAGVEGAALISIFGDVLGSAGRLGSAISEFGSATSTFGKLGGAFSAFSAIADIARGLQSFSDQLSGNTAAQRERNELVERNNDALDSLRGALKGFGDAIQDQATAGRAAADPIIRGLAQLSQNPINLFGDPAQQAIITRLQQEYGLSLADLVKVARDNGIELLTKQGRIAAGALEQFVESTRLAAQAAANFENTITDLQFIQRARREIFDLADPSAIFNDAIEQIEKFAPEIFKKFFAGIDISTESGRKAAEEAIRRAFEFATTKGIDLSAFLGGFESVEQFIDTILDADGALDSWSDAVREAASETVNMVEGFRDWNRARALFQAQEERIRGPIVSPTAMPPRPNPTPIPSGAASVTTVGSVSFSPTIVLADVGTKDITTLSTELVAELKRKANAIANPAVKATVNLLPA